MNRNERLLGMWRMGWCNRDGLQGMRETSMTKLQEFIEQVRGRIEKAMPIPSDGENGDICGICDASVLLRDGSDQDAWDYDPCCDSCAQQFRDTALIDLTRSIAVIKKLNEALDWIMPKVHQGNHEGEFATCGKATCDAYHQARADCEKILEKA